MAYWRGGAEGKREGGKERGVTYTVNSESFIGRRDGSLILYKREVSIPINDTYLYIHMHTCMHACMHTYILYMYR